MKLTLTEKKLIWPNIYSFYFKPETDFKWIPGQFLRYRINQEAPDERGQNRFFSIASAPFEGQIQLTTKFADNGSSFKNELLELQVGDNIEAFGPSGEFSIREGISNYIFIAGGIGITPFRSIILDLDHNKNPLDITLLYANRTTDLIFKEELEKIAREHKGFKINYFISEEKGEGKNVTDNVRIIPGRIDKAAVGREIENINSTVFYVSGPETMVYYFEDLLASLGVSGKNIVCDYYIGYESY
jgi:ferredoxin-NADP reductase